jgi:hypothetical protein
MQRSKKYLNAHTIVLGGLVTVLLTSGVAYAANEWTGKNIKDGTLTNADLHSGTVTGAKIKNGSLTSTDILDGTIGNQDLAGGAVDSAKVLDGSLTGADVLDESLDSADILNESLTSADLATDSVNATEVADNSIDAGEIVDFGLTNEDIGVLFAQVNADGSVANSSGGVTASPIGTGTYQVDFGRNISFCAFTATQGESGIGGAGGAIMGVTDRSGNANAVFATARNNTGALTNTAFQLVVVC